MIIVFAAAGSVTQNCQFGYVVRLLTVSSATSSAPPAPAPAGADAAGVVVGATRAARLCRQSLRLNIFSKFFMKK